MFSIFLYDKPYKRPIPKKSQRNILRTYITIFLYDNFYKVLRKPYKRPIPKKSQRNILRTYITIFLYDNIQKSLQGREGVVGGTVGSPTRIVYLGHHHRHVNPPIY